jgi:hypothetical protein
MRAAPKRWLKAVAAAIQNPATEAASSVLRCSRSLELVAHEHGRVNKTLQTLQLEAKKQVVAIASSTRPKPGAIQTLSAIRTAA